MSRIMRASRAVIAGGLLALGVAAVVSGQAGSPPASARTPMDELLIEVRAIRADLDRAAAASLRGQLLGMRLQLQEQRLAAISRQLSDVQERLRANQQARASLTSTMSMFAANKDKDQLSSEDRQQMNMMFAPLKQQLAALDKTDVDLKAEESALIGQLQEEQNRWTVFNGQVEELERASAGRNIR